MQTYPILQSGFIGIREKGLKRPDPIEPSFRDAVIFKESKSPLSKYKYSPTVKHLFLNWNSDPSLLKDFEFRAKIIKAAFESFGTNNFYQWGVLQDEKPTTSDLHNAFILETLDYLMLDVPRKIHNSIWIRLLEADERPSSVKIDITKHFRQESSNYDAFDVKLPFKLEGIILKWVQKERGFEDLLLSLYIIFGDRASRTTITKETT